MKVQENQGRMEISPPSSHLQKIDIYEPDDDKVTGGPLVRQQEHKQGIGRSNVWVGTEIPVTGITGMPQTMQTSHPHDLKVEIEAPYV